MKVKELIMNLLDCDLNSEVILSNDSEDNTYNAVYDVYNGSIYEKDGSEIIIYDLSWNHDDADLDEDVWETKKKELNSCVVIYPS